MSRRRVPLPEGFLTGTIPPRHPIRELESSDPTRLRRRELLGGEQVEYQGLSIHCLRSIDPCPQNSWSDLDEQTVLRDISSLPQAAFTLDGWVCRSPTILY